MAGLSFAAAGTLIFVPVLYTIFVRIPRTPRSRRVKAWAAGLGPKFPEGRIFLILPPADVV